MALAYADGGVLLEKIERRSLADRPAIVEPTPERSPFDGIS